MAAVGVAHNRLLTHLRQAAVPCTERRLMPIATVSCRSGGSKFDPQHGKVLADQLTNVAVLPLVCRGIVLS